MDEGGEFSLASENDMDMESEWKLERRRVATGVSGACAGVISAWQHRQLFGRPCLQLSEQLVAGPAHSCSRQLTDLHEQKMVEAELKEQVCEIPSTAKSTFLMVFSGDGKRMASTHGDHNIYITDTSSGKLVTTLQGHPRTPWCVVFHPTNPHLVASGCLGGEVRVWDQTGGSERWQSHDCRVIASLAFHPVDHVLAIATGNDLYFWNWKTREPFVQCNTLHPRERLRYVKFDSYGHKLLTAISNVNSADSVPGPGTGSGAGSGAEWSAGRYGSGPSLSGWLSRRQEGGRRNYLDSVYQSLMRRYEQLQAQYLALRLRRRQTEELHYRALVNDSTSQPSPSDPALSTGTTNDHHTPSSPVPPISPPPPIPPPPPPPQHAPPPAAVEGVAAARQYSDAVTRRHGAALRQHEVAETRFVLGWAQTVIDALLEAIDQMIESAHRQPSVSVTGPPAFVAPELQHSGALLASALADMATHLQLGSVRAPGASDSGVVSGRAPFGSEGLQDVASINGLIRTQLVDMTRILLDPQIRQRVLSGVSSLWDSLLTELRVLRRLLCAVREQCCSLCAHLDSGPPRAEAPAPGSTPGTGMSLLTRRHLMRRSLRRQQYRRNPRRLSVSDSTLQTAAPPGAESDSVSNSSDESSAGVSRSAFSSFSRLRDPLHVRALTRPSRSLLALRRSQSRSNMLRGDHVLRRSHTLLGLERRHLRSSLLVPSSAGREAAPPSAEDLRQEDEAGPFTSSAGSRFEVRAVSSGGGQDLNPGYLSSGIVRYSTSLSVSSGGGMRDTTLLSASSSGGVRDSTLLSASSVGELRDLIPLSALSGGGIRDSRLLSASSGGGMRDTTPHSASSSGGVRDSTPLPASTGGGMRVSTSLSAISTGGGVRDSTPLPASSGGGMRDTAPLSTSSGGGARDCTPRASSGVGVRDSVTPVSSTVNSSVSGRLTTPTRFSRWLSLLLERVTSTVPPQSVSEASEEVPLQSLLSSAAGIPGERTVITMEAVRQSPSVVTSSIDHIGQSGPSSILNSSSYPSSSTSIVRSTPDRLLRSSLLASLPRTLSSARDFSPVFGNDPIPWLTNQRSSNDLILSATSVHSPIPSITRHSTSSRVGSSFSAGEPVYTSTSGVTPVSAGEPVYTSTSGVTPVSVDPARNPAVCTSSFPSASRFSFSFAATIPSIDTVSSVSSASILSGASGSEVPIRFPHYDGNTLSASSVSSVSIAPTSYRSNSERVSLAGAELSFSSRLPSLSLTNSVPAQSVSATTQASVTSSPLHPQITNAPPPVTAVYSTSSGSWWSTASTWSSAPISLAVPVVSSVGVGASSRHDASDSPPIVRVRQHRVSAVSRAGNSPYDRISSVHRVASRHRFGRSSALLVGVPSVSDTGVSPASSSTTTDESLPTSHRRLDMLVQAARLLEQDSDPPASSTSLSSSSQQPPSDPARSLESVSASSPLSRAAPPPHLSPFLSFSSASPLQQRPVSAIRRVARAPLRPRDVMLGSRDPFLGAGGPGVDTDDSPEEDTIGFVRQRPRAAPGVENVFPGSRGAARERAVPLEDIGSLFIGGEGLPFGVAGGGYDSFFQVLCSGHPHVTHRLQAWDFSQLQIPDISNDRVNMVSERCKIHNDAAVDIASDATCVATVVREPPATSVCVFSLVTKHLGRLLYRVPLSVNIVSVSLSPNSRFLVVGLATRRMMALSSDSQVMAQVFRLNAASGQAVVVKSLMLNNSPMSSRYSSINCIRFLPEVGAGFVYGTNRGRLVMLKA